MANPIRQYVNLDPGNTKLIGPDGAALDKKRAGRSVSVTARLDQGKSGKTVVFEIHHQQQTFDPKTALVTIRPQISKRFVKTDGKGEATLQYDLPLTGGDEVTFWAYYYHDAKTRLTLALQTYQVWRLFYIQLCTLDTMAKGKGRSGASITATRAPWKSFKGGGIHRVFADQFVEVVEDKPKKEVLKRTLNVLSRTPTGNYDAAEKARYLSEGLDAANGRYDYTIGLTMVNQIAVHDAAVETYRVSGGNLYQVKVKRPLWYDPSQPVAEDFFRAGRWEEIGGSQGGLVPVSWIKEVGSDTAFGLDLRSLDKARKYRIELSLKYFSGGINGFSAGKVTCVAEQIMSRSSPARSADSICQTVIHEWGHSLGKVHGGQATVYSGHGHRGSHCNTGLSAADLADASYGGKSGTCVMFGESAPGRRADFCKHCAASLRSKPLVVKA